MRARYAGGESGARRAARDGAVIVVVDAFRASTTIAVLVSKGARVVPVASIEEAAAAEADFRVGERGSAKVAGFDFGNSPTEILASEIPFGSTGVLSTTNGTRVIEASAGASAILIGAFVNAEAVADELAAGIYGEEVVVVGCGWEGRRASEDEAASGAILHRLRERGAKLDERARRVVQGYLTRPESHLRRNSAARRLRRLHYEPDLDFCLAEDTVPVVPRLADGVLIGGGVAQIIALRGRFLSRPEFCTRNRMDVQGVLRLAEYANIVARWSAKRLSLSFNPEGHGSGLLGDAPRFAAWHHSPVRESANKEGLCRLRTLSGGAVLLLW